MACQVRLRIINTPNLSKTLAVAVVLSCAAGQQVHAALLTLETTVVGSGIFYDDGSSVLDDDYIDPGVSEFYAESFVEDGSTFYSDANMELFPVGSSYILFGSLYNDIFLSNDPSTIVESYLIATLNLDTPFILSFFVESYGDFEPDSLFEFDYSVVGNDENILAGSPEYYGFIEEENIYLDAGVHEIAIFNVLSGDGFAETYIEAVFTPVTVPDSGQTLAMAGLSLLLLAAARLRFISR